MKKKQTHIVYCETKKEIQMWIEYFSKWDWVDIELRIYTLGPINAERNNEQTALQTARKTTKRAV